MVIGNESLQGGGSRSDVWAALRGMPVRTMYTLYYVYAHSGAP